MGKFLIAGLGPLLFALSLAHSARAGSRSAETGATSAKIASKPFETT